MDIRGTTGPQWAFAPTAGNVFNPFGQDLRGANFRSIAVGPRTNVFDVDNIAVTGWLDGSFDLGGRAMYWDAGYSYLNARFAQNGQNYINLFNLRRAVGDSRRNPVTGRLECLNGTTVIAGCVPYNLFGGADLGLGAGVISREEYDAMNQLHQLRSESADRNHHRRTSSPISPAKSSKCRPARWASRWVPNTVRPTSSTSPTPSWPAAVRRTTSRNRPAAKSASRKSTPN